MEGVPGRLEEAASGKFYMAKGQQQDVLSLQRPPSRFDDLYKAIVSDGSPGEVSVPAPHIEKAYLITHYEY
jgi:hypothetical protein